MPSINLSNRQIRNIHTHHSNNLARDHIVPQRPDEKSSTLDPNTIVDIQQRPIGFKIREASAVVIACDSG